MLKRILEFLVPTLTDLTEARSNQNLVRTITLILILAAGGALVLEGFIFGNPTTVSILTPLLVILFIILLLNRPATNQLARLLVPVVVLSGSTSLIAAGGGIHDSIAMIITLPVIVAGLVMGTNGQLFIGILSIIALVGVASAEMTGMITNNFSESTDLTDIPLIIIALGTIVAAQRLLTRRLTDNAERARKSEQEQLNTNAELRNLQISLEDRIAQRTAELAKQSSEVEQQSQELFQANMRIERRAVQLQAISVVSGAIRKVRNLKETLPQIADVISKQFGYYHVGIFLVDEARQYAILSASNSQGGARMLKRGHRLRVGQVGIVGDVAFTGNPRIALDTGEDAAFFNNPDLPETRSEMAVPLIIENQIIGVLDIQSTEQNAFGEEDVEVILTLAEQVSIAIENARLFDATQKSLAEAETIYRQYLRSEWQGFTRKQSLKGYQYSITGATPLGEDVDLPAFREVMEEGKVYTDNGEKSNTAAIAVPVKLRDETIGILNIRTPGERRWSQDDIDLISAVAERVAISVENARLFEETTSRAERERAVSEITAKIRSTNDPNLMLQIALDELKQVLNVKDARIITREQKKA